MKCLVTGGGGFVGKALCFRLHEMGHEVRSISRGCYPELTSRGIATFQGDLSGETSSYEEAFQSCDVVFHVAAKVDMWGRYEGFFKANILATRNVLSLCRKHGVRSLVYTSSPSVISDGSNLEGVDEQYPYPSHYLAFYPQTKAQAEREVLSSNNDSLWTIALRPHLIWGPGDTNLVPTILERAKKGRLVRVGDGTNKVDTTYIEDCVEAHVKAWEAIRQNPSSRGRVYFISQGDPVNLWEWINEVLLRHNLQPITRSVPRRVASALAAVFEVLSSLGGRKKEPLLTRFLVSEMASSHFFDISAAKRDLGYCPSCSVNEALDKTYP